MPRAATFLNILQVEDTKQVPFSFLQQTETYVSSHDALPLRTWKHIKSLQVKDEVVRLQIQGPAGNRQTLTCSLPPPQHGRYFLAGLQAMWLKCIWLSKVYPHETMHAPSRILPNRPLKSRSECIIRWRLTECPRLKGVHPLRSMNMLTNYHRIFPWDIWYLFCKKSLDTT